MSTRKIIALSTDYRKPTSACNATKKPPSTRLRRLDYFIICHQATSISESPWLD